MIPLTASMHPESLMSWEEAVLWLRDQADQRELVEACFYDDPLEEAAERYYRSSEWQAVRALLPAHCGPALDIGAGRGIASYALARDGWLVTAVEPDRSPVVGSGAIRTLGQQTGLPITVVEQNGEELPLPNESFDLTHCRAVLHHAKDLHGFCREVTRVLRPGGLFLATREHVISRREDLPTFLASHPLHKLYGGEQAYLLDEYRAAIVGAGLHLVRVLNPYASDVNLFPDSRAALKDRLASRFCLPSSRFVPDVLLDWMGARLKHPGRHYSFLAHKP